MVVGMVLGGLVVAVMLFEQKTEVDQLKQQILIKDQQIAEMIDRERMLQDKVKELEGVRAELQTEVSAIRDELASAKTELTRSQNDLAEAQDRYNRLVAQQERLDSEMTYLKAERDAAESSASEARKSHEKLKESVVVLRNRLMLLDREYRKLSEARDRNEVGPPPDVLVVGDSRNSQLDPRKAILADSGTGVVSANWSMQNYQNPKQQPLPLPNVVVPREQENRSLPPVTGKLISVNPTERFVVLDKGTQDGVSVGMHFEVMRNSVPISKLRVVRVRDSLAACDVLNTDALNVLNTGDVAVELN